MSAWGRLLPDAAHKSTVRLLEGRRGFIKRTITNITAIELIVPTNCRSHLCADTSGGGKNDCKLYLQAVANRIVSRADLAGHFKLVRGRQRKA